MRAGMLLFWQLEKHSERKTVTMPLLPRRLLGQNRSCSQLLKWRSLYAILMLNDTFLTPRRLACLSLHYWCSRDLATLRSLTSVCNLMGWKQVCIRQDKNQILIRLVQRLHVFLHSWHENRMPRWRVGIVLCKPVVDIFIGGSICQWQLYCRWWCSYSQYPIPNTPNRLVPLTNAS